VATSVRARVLIRPKAGILDPQGVAVELDQPADVEDPSQLEAMCEKLLANPLVEDYEILESGPSA
jgi:phosphoribosylformylglycinamidine synthase